MTEKDSNLQLNSFVAEAETMVGGREGGQSKGMMEDELLGSFAPESEKDDDAVSHGAEPSVASDTSSIAGALDVLGNVDVAYETAFVSSMDVNVVKTIEIILAPRVEELQVDALGVGIEYEEVEGPTCVAQLEVQTSRMLIGDCAVDELKPSKITLTSHFFGVYDGHGGSQVANYCQEHIHLALLNKLRNLMEHSEWIIGNDDCQKQWEKAFSDCFLKVDDEVGGKVRKEDDIGSSSEASVVGLVAPETVGSAVVISAICSSHIIIANCGDSRAVLCRGKTSHTFINRS
ncbi:putative protein phosphatase 2C 6 [Platanthera guangdongensis]|uniref:protein-serine/threonine phosphatase n=1 Tax=Platanthera guangdongensis TaxID=2320717 RepID=A0ABR2LK41_9ASPA